MYQVLYRKYRPKVFSDVYGQEHITSTLLNEIKENRIAHAYLFTGSRGTGKTTCAKILAKAVNCENSVNGEPCGECEVCRGLDNGTIYDVVEIDAASNNGVDNIRDLREEANYTPTRCKYRVYIIDEVHMLSAGAFNALLKTLEEPPAHVIFILATTEVHKLPSTILSRCQRFDFKRIQSQTMANRLKEVAGYENIHLDDEAALLISRIADGGMRDALSILDQCAGRSNNIDTTVVSNATGIAGRESLFELSRAVCNQNGGDALNIISQLHQNSYDMERLCVEMINHFRNFLIVKTVTKNRELIVCTDDEYKMILDSAKEFTLAKVIFALDLFQDTLTKIKAGANSRIEMEMSFVKLCEPKLENSMDSILDRISKLERDVRNGVKISTNAPVSNVEIVNTVKEKVEVKEPVINNFEDKKEEKVVLDLPKSEEKSFKAKEETYNIFDNEPQFSDEELRQSSNENELIKENTNNSVESNTNDIVENNSQTLFTQWPEFMEEIHNEDIAMYGILSGSRAYIRGDFFLIESNNATLRQFIKKSNHSKAIKKAIFNVTGKVYKLGLFKNNNTNEVKKDLLEDLIEKSKGNIEIKFE